MKRVLLLLLCVLLLTGCAPSQSPAQVAATTLPVYEFTLRLCAGTGITVTRLVTEQVSCLHDYSLNVRQVRAAEAAELLVLSGAGLEVFLEDLLTGKPAVDASAGIPLLCPEARSHADGEHGHEADPHIWLSPANARTMARNICAGLTARYPAHAGAFEENLAALLSELEALEAYGLEALSNLACRELITFHDGFAYLAQAFGLTVLQAVEEESGREASARELIHIIEAVQTHRLPAIFTERSGSVSAAGIIARETGCGCFSLDMAMAGDSYFDAMYRNIDTLREALG